MMIMIIIIIVFDIIAFSLSVCINVCVYLAYCLGAGWLTLTMNESLGDTWFVGVGDSTVLKQFN